MSYGHPWRGPERDDETQVDRVAHELVKRRRLEARGWHRAADKIVDHLMQAEQLEMVDEKARREPQKPAEERQAHHRHCNLRISDLPNHVRHRPPLPEQ